MGIYRTANVQIKVFPFLTLNKKWEMVPKQELWDYSLNGTKTSSAAKQKLFIELLLMHINNTTWNNRVWLSAKSDIKRSQYPPSIVGRRPKREREREMKLPNVTSTWLHSSEVNQQWARSIGQMSASFYLRTIFLLTHPPTYLSSISHNSGRPCANSFYIYVRLI